MRLFIITAFILGFVSACASTPKFDLTGVNTGLTPKSVIAEINIMNGQSVVWGGVVLSSENLKNTTQIEVLAYPLDSSYLPMLSRVPLGRYIINHAGYLETTIFEAGRMISSVGQIDGIKKGRVGEADYDYPLINSRELHLWNRDSGRSRTTFHFGLGVQL